MPPPSREAEANARKARTDAAVREMFRDGGRSDRIAETASALILKDGGPARVVVGGASGSGKTEISSRLGQLLGVPSFDLDEWVEGGGSEDRVEDDRRVAEAVMAAWPDVPRQGGWVVEHVRAFCPTVVGIFSPGYALLSDPGRSALETVAALRESVSPTDGFRHHRAVTTMDRALAEWRALPGEDLGKGEGWRLRKLGRT